MPKFEYRILTEPCLNSDRWKLQDLLNKLGQEGFEIVSTALIYKDSAMTIVLKRETPDPSTPAPRWRDENKFDGLLQDWHKAFVDVNAHPHSVEKGRECSRAYHAMLSYINPDHITEEAE